MMNQSAIQDTPNKKISDELLNSLRSPSPSPSPSPSSPSPRNNTDILSLQKELKDKQRELTVAYQTSLKLIETNNELQQQLEEQSITTQTLDANIIDYEMKIDLLEAENMEYQQTIHQTNDKYEETLGELAVTRQHLNNAMDEIKQYQQTMQSLNHNIIHNANDSPLKSLQNDNNHNKLHRNNNNNNNNNIDYKNNMEKQQKKYDELLRECEKYRNDHSLLIEQEIEIQNLKKDIVKMEKRNKSLSDETVELTYNNVELEKEINDCSTEIDEKNETIQYLQTENQNLMTKRLLTTPSNMNEFGSSEPNKSNHKQLYSPYGGADTSLGRFVINNNNNNNTNDLKRKLSVQLRSNFSDNSKLVMFANNINENGLINGVSRYGDNDTMDGMGQDLFTMVQNYENNEEYFVQNAEDEGIGTMDEDNGEQDSVFSLEYVANKCPLLSYQLGIILLFFQSYFIMFPISIEQSH